MINSNTSFGKLKEVIVGRELTLDKRTVDLTFKYFYKEALVDQNIFEMPFDKYRINSQILEKRIKELDDLANTLTSLGIKVHRPNIVNRIRKIKTPTFETEATSASNVRDLTLVYKNVILETPTFVRGRYFENMEMYSIFDQCYDNGNGGLWIKAPQTQLIKQTLDLVDWKEDRNFNNIPNQIEMAIDGAQFLRIGRDVIVNVATENHYKGLQWVKSFFPDTHFHMVKLCDSHIDGNLICLKPGVFLCNPINRNIRDQLPAKFKNWKYLYPENLTETIDVTKMTDLDIRLASSRGMDINVLSIDENTVVVYNRAVGVIKILEENGFNVIPVQLDNGEIFAGGIHCSTLDLVREDEYIFYA
jgi:glycine amidinotransferase